MNLNLTDKTALISGSTKGIGFAIATQFAHEGARVIVNGRSNNAITEALAHIRRAVPEARVESFAGDLSTAESVEALLLQFPSVDVLVNNLGIFEPKPFEDIPDEDWRRFFEVNVLSGVRLSRAYLPGMKQRDWGRIVFISSESGIQIPVRDDSLRHHQDCSTCSVPWLGGDLRRHGRHRQRSPPGTHSLRRGG